MCHVSRPVVRLGCIFHRCTAVFSPTSSRAAWNKSRIWDSLAADDTVTSLGGAQRAELDRRLADHEADPDNVVAWEDVEASILSRLGR